MDNATPLEMQWTVMFVVGVVEGAILLGYFVAKLVRRYRRRLNGGGRLLAWREVAYIAALVVAAWAGMTLGALALMAPARPEAATGVVERWAMDTLAWYGPASLMAIGLCIDAALTAVLVFEVAIDRYFSAHTAVPSDFDDDNAADMAAEPEALRVNTLTVEANTVTVQANTEAVEANTAAQADKEE